MSSPYSCSERKSPTSIRHDQACFKRLSVAKCRLHVAKCRSRTARFVAAHSSMQLMFSMWMSWHALLTIAILARATIPLLMRLLPCSVWECSKYLNIFPWCSKAVIMQAWKLTLLKPAWLGNTSEHYVWSTCLHWLSLTPNCSFTQVHVEFSATAEWVERRRPAIGRHCIHTITPLCPIATKLYGSDQHCRSSM